ncbi:MAG: hypothetical protein COA79_23475 [Planctomycetota bacterium]|nr:MAG: hypothetical protein COA79_23475 [Planctomycetota bacterium]
MGKSIYIILGFLAFALIFGGIGFTSYLLMKSEKHAEVDSDKNSLNSISEKIIKKNQKPTTTNKNTNTYEEGPINKKEPTQTKEPINNNKIPSKNKKNANNNKPVNKPLDRPGQRGSPIRLNPNDRFTSPEMKKYQKAGFQLITEGSLEITFIEMSSKKRLKNKAVQIKIGLKDESIQTDENGIAQIKNLPVGNWPYKISATDFNVSFGQVKIRKGNGRLIIYLKNTGTIKVKATSLTGASIEDLNMKLNGKLFSLIKEKENVFRHEIPTGTNNISFESDGFQKTQKYTVAIGTNKTSEIFIQLTPTNTIKLKFKGLNSLPNNIRILTSSAKNWRLSTKSFPDLKGNFDVEYVDLSNDILIQVPFHTPFPIYASDREEYTKTFNQSNKGEISVFFNNKPLVTAYAFFPDYGITIPADKKGIIHIPDIEQGLKLKYIIGAEGFKSNTSMLISNEKITKQSHTLKTSDTEALTVVDENDEPVSKATVHIFESKGRKHTFYKSDELGSVILSDLKNGTYLIVCHHISYGAAQKPIVITDTDLAEGALVFKLKPQKSLEILVSDSKGSPLENRIIEIKGAFKYKNDAFNTQLEYTMTTDKEGKIKILNMIPDHYRIRIFDDLYESNWRIIKVPHASVLKINAKLKNFIAITLKTPEGNIYNDVATFFYRHGTKIVPIKVDKVENNKYYINRKAFNRAWSFYPMVQTVGYSLGNFGFTRSGSALADEITFDLRKGATLKLNIIEKKTANKLTGASASFSYNNTYLFSLPSDETGVIIAEGLEANFNVTITHSDFTEHTIEFQNFTEYQELKIEMIKGGIIKGKYIRNANQANVIAIVKLTGPVQREIQIGKEDYFEFAKLPIGQYELSVYIGDRQNNLDKIKLPNPINLIDEQVVEIDIDESSLRLGNITGKIDILKDMGSLNFTVQLFDRTSWLKSIGGASAKPVNTYTAKPDGLFEFNELNPGKYLIRVQAGTNRTSERWITVHSETTETMSIAYPPYRLSLDVQFETGGDKSIDRSSPKIMIFIFEEDTYSYINAYDFYNRATRSHTNYGRHSGFYLTPKVNYTIILQEDLRYNYDLLRVSNIINNDSSNLSKSYTLPKGRVFTEIKVVDSNNKPIKDAAYLIIKNNEVFQRDLWQSGDMFPFTNSAGKFSSRGLSGADESPRGWPIETFNLQISAKGFAAKTITLEKSIDTSEPVIISLEKENSIIVNIIESPDYPFSIGIIKDGTNKILSLPTPLEKRLNHTFTTYTENVGRGQYSFLNLPKGSYKIGIYINGTNELLGTSNKIIIDKSSSQIININVSELINQ